jgi:hypothetical protein
MYFGHKNTQDFEFEKKFAKYSTEKKNLELKVVSKIKIILKTAKILKFYQFLTKAGN